MILIVTLALLALYAAMTGDWYGVRWLGALVAISGALWWIGRFARGVATKEITTSTAPARPRKHTWMAYNDPLLYRGRHDSRIRPDIGGAGLDHLARSRCAQG